MKRSLHGSDAGKGFNFISPGVVLQSMEQGCKFMCFDNFVVLVCVDKILELHHNRIKYLYTNTNFYEKGEGEVGGDRLTGSGWSEQGEGRLEVTVYFYLLLLVNLEPWWPMSLLVYRVVQFVD